eukprot:CAMPEP_0172609630 /NCGR_PEP_ID=MMETSP1068-20121228/29594_1 /TAXON_ID=35684 /ORGANISM="Pseudopedinella elastica, Strain CCMP716" /LENGTH=137 /DNA_ID=CAMNT_0013413189 /DNA_START=22 /DNA_END=435 /DNA_ORIENTATION=+
MPEYSYHEPHANKAFSNLNGPPASGERYISSVQPAQKRTKFDRKVSSTRRPLTFQLWESGERMNDLLKLIYFCYLANKAMAFDEARVSASFLTALNEHAHEDAGDPPRGDGHGNLRAMSRDDRLGAPDQATGAQSGP